MPLVMVAFGLLLFGAMYKVLFGQAKSLHKQLFVEAASVDGVRPMTASIRHVLPNMSTTVIVQFVLLFGVGIGFQAALAFIGLGPQPPEPTWGGMIQTASRFIFQEPWMMVPTGAILALTIIAANSLADVLAGGTAMPPPLVALRRKKSKTPVTQISASALSDDLPAEEWTDREAPEGFAMIGDASIPSSNIDRDAQRERDAGCGLDRRHRRRGRADRRRIRRGADRAADGCPARTRRASSSSRTSSSGSTGARARHRRVAARAPGVGHGPGR